MLIATDSARQKVTVDAFSVSLYGCHSVRSPTTARRAPFAVARNTSTKLQQLYHRVRLENAKCSELFGLYAMLLYMSETLGIRL